MLKTLRHHLTHPKHRKKVYAGAAIAIGFAFFCLPVLGSKVTWVANVESAEEATTTKTVVQTGPAPRVVTHIKTPEAVRGLYMTSNYAADKTLRETIVKLLTTTEANTVIIDVKDFSGKVFIPPTSKNVLAAKSYEKRIPDIENFIDELHAKGIYVIARIATFQDQYMVKSRPDLAVLNKNTGESWGDRKNIHWIDPGSHEMWDYVASIGKDAYALGFDEINYDYIRFPSDGNMSLTKYRFYDAKTMTKEEQIRLFYKYLHDQFSPMGIPISGDLFGMTTSVDNDLGIGQLLENALENFDYVAPMVYPSHYPTGFNGYKNPAAVPYEIIKFGMGRGVERAVAASTTPLKLRPWLQDFNMGATYTADLIRAEKKAVYDVGLTSWMMWDPANTYTAAALNPKK